MTVDLKTTYLGLKLKNPLAASCSPLTGKLDSLKQLEDAGMLDLEMGLDLLSFHILLTRINRCRSLCIPGQMGQKLRRLGQGDCIGILAILGQQIAITSFR